MSALADYLSIALPVFGATVITLGGCMCCAWRRLERRLNHFEEVLRDVRPVYVPPQQIQIQSQIQSHQQKQQQPYYPTAPPAIGYYTA
jgi:hypothetical protein